MANGFRGDGQFYPEWKAIPQFCRPNGSVPYIVVDRWGVVRGYVAAAQGVELESCLGQQVSLQGTIKTLPGGDMPYMTCQRGSERQGGDTESACSA